MEFNFLLIMLGPLFGFLMAAFLSLGEMLLVVRLNSKLACLAVVGATFISTCLSLRLFYLNAIGNLGDYWFDLKYGQWFNLGANMTLSSDLGFFQSFVLRWGFLFDPLSLTMLLVITFVSVLVQLYAIEYMGHDVNRTRFMGYLALFVFFMVVLVTADNFIQLFIGWEGVGLVSYLLISFWFTRVEAARSALKAVAVNKFGDYALVMFIVFSFYTCGTVDFDALFYVFGQMLQIPVIEFPLGLTLSLADFLAFFLLIAAVGKSAQLGLHTWLPDAMEGPTPVSALIHAATMVTAGVYLLVRSSPVLESSPIILAATALIGATTALFGATTALFQNDLKKVIAYSTCSQLGYMICACGLSSYSVAMFHLTNHAFFKALLFLCAGAVIHAMHDEQDMRRMGGLLKILPFTYSVMTIGSLSLAGFPFLSGYYSKDLVLEVALSTSNFIGLYCFVVGVLAAVFTVLYSIRLSYFTFITKTNAFRSVIFNSHEAPFLMAFPLFVLACLSIVSGWLLRPYFIGAHLANFDFWKNSFTVLPNNHYTHFHIHSLDLLYRNLPTLMVIGSAMVTITIYYFYFTDMMRILLPPRKRNIPFALMSAAELDPERYGLTPISFLARVLRWFAREFFLFFSKKWYFDVIYSRIVLDTYHIGYQWVFRSVDRGFLNYFFLPLGVNVVLIFSRFLAFLHSGYIYRYFFFFVLFLFIFLYYLF
jgi:proton-translocating NADH-quinone oxidoreductase chain L